MGVSAGCLAEKKYMAVICLQLRHDPNIFLIENQDHFPSYKDRVTCYLSCCYWVFETVIFVCPACHSGSPPVRITSWFSSEYSFASVSICFWGMWPEYVTQSFLETASYALGQWSIFWDNTFSELCGKRSSLFLGKPVASGGHHASKKLESSWIR